MDTEWSVFMEYFIKRAHYCYITVLITALDALKPYRAHFGYALSL